MKDALKTLKAQGKAFQAVIDIANALEGIDSIEQATSEAQAGLDQARKELDAFKADADKEKSAIDNDLIDAHMNLDNAKAEAETIIEEAKAEASKIRSTASKSAITKTQNAEQKVQEAIDDLGKLNQTISDREAELKALEDKIEKANKEIDKLKSKMGF